jgi:putative PEP-CTERM system histidine kinase
MSFGSLLGFAGAVLAALLACGVAIAAKRVAAHWAFAAGMLVLAVESTITAIAADAVLPSEAKFWQDTRLVMVSFLPGVWILFSSIYARGNAAQVLVRRGWSFALALLIPVALALYSRGTLIADVGTTKEGVHVAFLLSGPGFAINVFLLLGGVIVLMNLERTYRAAVGTMRWRIKFMVIGLGVLFAVRTFTCSQVLMFGFDMVLWQAISSGALVLGCLLMTRTLFRTGHFEVNVYPSQAVLHNTFTILLAGVYLFIIGALAEWLPRTAGFTFGILVALVLLTMVLFSDRVRMRTRQFISRHFQRPLYDYRTLWRTFAEATARRVEQTDFCKALAKLLSEVFQALSVSIWLVDESKQKLQLAASTSILQAKEDEVELEATDASELIAVLSTHPEPVDLDASKDAWAAYLRRIQPEGFRKGGNRVGVPIKAGGELLGLITLGDRVSGMQFTTQDFDLLKSVGDQAAASLLNIKLSHQLSQAKQLEAFQAMSAFFVHDLKNTASTLSLMLQNLPIHYNDPKFREDALRGISYRDAHQ